MDALVYISCSEELEKTAGPILNRIWKSGLGRAGVGALGGAAAGALASPEDRLKGAVRGGALGAGLGYASPLLTAAGRKGFGERVKDIYQAQVHGLTGRGSMPKRGLKGKDLERLERLENAGLTNIPGVMKAIRKNPKQTIKALYDDMGTLGKGMMALDLASQAHNVATNPEARTGESVGGALGSTVGYALGGALPFSSSSLLGAAGGTAGKLVGRGIGKLVGSKESKDLSLKPIQKFESVRRLGENALPVSRVSAPYLRMSGE